MHIRKLTLLALFVALMLVLGYVESLIPFFPSVPGIKLGLSNAVILFTLIVLGWKEAFSLMLLKVVLSGLLFSGVSGMLYALAGGVCSIAGMALIRLTKGVSEIGISVTGAIMHNLGQVLAAAFIAGTWGVLSYMPVLLVPAVFTGIATSMAAKAAIAITKGKII